MSEQQPEDFWQTLPLGRDVTLITRDANGLAAFSKPAGTLSHPNETRDQPRSLLNARYERDGEFFEWGNERNSTGTDSTSRRRLWLLNRLDSATSGVILAAASEELASEIRALFKQRHIAKTYIALVFGTPSEKAQIWRDKLAVQKHGGQIRTATHAGNIPAEAHMALLRTQRNSPQADGGPLSLIQLEPKTGRSHQLRVQCAKRHLPIVGDATYGDFKANRAFAKGCGEKRLFLHSLETRFEYEWKGRSHIFSAKAAMPGEFEVFG